MNTLLSVQCGVYVCVIHAFDSAGTECLQCEAEKCFDMSKLIKNETITHGPRRLLGHASFDVYWRSLACSYNHTSILKIFTNSLRSVFVKYLFFNSSVWLGASTEYSRCDLTCPNYL